MGRNGGGAAGGAVVRHGLPDAEPPRRGEEPPGRDEKSPRRDAEPSPEPSRRDEKPQGGGGEEDMAGKEWAGTRRMHATCARAMGARCGGPRFSLTRGTTGRQRGRRGSTTKPLRKTLVSVCARKRGRPPAGLRVPRGCRPRPRGSVRCADGAKLTCILTSLALFCLRNHLGTAGETFVFKPMTFAFRGTGGDPILEACAAADRPSPAGAVSEPQAADAPAAKEGRCAHARTHARTHGSHRDSHSLPSMQARADMQIWSSYR